MLVDLNENQTRSGNKVKYRNYKKREKDKGKCFYFSCFSPHRTDEASWLRFAFVFYFLFVVIRSAANIRLNFYFLFTSVSNGFDLIVGIVFVCPGLFFFFPSSFVLSGLHK